MAVRKPAWLILIAAIAPASAHAEIKVGIYGRSLQGVPTQFVLRQDAPVTTFALAGGDETLFREAEVPPDRIGVTRGLMSDLKARTTPQREIVVDLPSDVLFDFDKSDLRPDAAASLQKAAELLKSYPDAPIAINGHTDAKGDEAYNVPLSERRARAVAVWLERGADRRFTVRGFGESRPVAANQTPDGRDDPAGRQKNRRVEIVISPPARS